MKLQIMHGIHLVLQKKHYIHLVRSQLLILYLPSVRNYKQVSFHKKNLNMVRFQFFPRSIGVVKPIEDVLNAFKNVESEIDSKTSNKKSDDVLAAVEPYLTKLKYNVEKDKSSKGKIDVPVLFGNNNTIDKSFYADAISCDGKIVIEVEAGRATENNQFLKDIFEASMMFEVEYLILAVRNIYRGHDDFERIYTFLETMYISNRIKLPLKGILLIGY